MRSPVIFFVGFILGFSLEVRVKAEGSVQLRNITSLSLNNRVLQEPKGCFEQSSKCAFQISLGRKLDIPFSGGRWYFSQNSMLIRQGDWSELRLVEGMLRFKAETGGRGTIVTDLIQVILEGTSASADVFVEKNKDQVRVVNVGDHDVAISRRTAQGFQSRREFLPPGTEILVERPSSRSGDVEIGLPVPFDFEDQVIREARLFDGKKAEFHVRVAQLIEKRNQAAELVAPVHEAMAKRTIASIERQREEARRGRAQREARDRELRLMFRKRVLEVQ